MAQRKICVKCAQSKPETKFFKKKDGTRHELCRDCLTALIDNRNPDTFLWILEDFDVPYVEKLWVKMTNEVYLADPANFGPDSVIGRYIRTMKMTQWCNYGFKDSDKLNASMVQKIEDAEGTRLQTFGETTDEYRERLKKELEAGEISEAKYRTLMVEDLDEEQFDYEGKESPLSKPPENPGFIIPVVEMNEATVRDQLTEEDIRYLALKWGTNYKPTEWVTMEESYQQYAAENDLNADRESTLRKICKTSLKMDQALDTGDINAYKNLSVVFDQLRKSGKFTEAQNQEEVTRDLDSIGELVAFVEREGGVIPCYYDPIDYPQDKIDFIIKDMQHYVTKLVKEDLGLGNLIESFIEKADKKKDNSVETIMRDSFKEVDPEDDILTAEEEVEYQDFILAEIEEESLRLLEEFDTGGDD